MRYGYFDSEIIGTDSEGNLTSLPPSFLKETVDIINQTIYNVNCDNSCMEAYYDYF